MMTAKIVRAALVAVVFAAVGLSAFYLTALISVEPSGPAWDKGGFGGVILWAYERGSGITILVLFLLALACGWLMPFNRLLAALSLALFYPAFAIVRLVFDSHFGNLLPFEFVGYALFMLVCLLGYGVGRLVSRFVPKPA